MIILLSEGKKVANNWDQEGYLDKTKYTLNAIFGYEINKLQWEDEDDKEEE